jgi:hypothetical protein
LAFNRKPSGTSEGPDGSLRDTVVGLPLGLVGNPTAAATCDNADLLPAGSSNAVCPIASQVGVAKIFTLPGESNADIVVPVYNMVRPIDAPAAFAFNYAGSPVRLIPEVRPDDYGLSVSSTAITQAIPPLAVDVTIWGVPADPSHDPERVNTIDPLNVFLGTPSPGPREAFLRNPTGCADEPVSFTAAADSWQAPGAFVSAAFSSDFEGNAFLFGGCERLAFTPAMTAKFDVRRAASPAGLNVAIHVPQNEAPDSLATPDLRKTVITLPEGVAVSPAAAAGLGACSLGQIGLGTADAPSCPASSEIGTISLKTPLLEEELSGEVFLARQKENPFGTLLAMYLAIRGPGFYLKIPGKIDADARTGQLTATFDNTPQLPFEDLNVQLFGGANAALVLPDECGTFQTEVQMTSWASSTPYSFTTPLTVDEGCNTGGFSPGLKAGTTNPAAGKFSPFTLQVTREDGEQNLSRIEATLPEGVLAKLAGVPLCPDAQAATGTCPVASQVGTTTIGVGAGSNPLYVPEAGKAPTAVYLAGPYKGAPYSLVVKVPAQAGPFDLGTVTVRNGLYVDPTTTQVTAKSDPLPQILEGIPLSYRDVRVEITRNEFTINPTNCEPMKVTSTLTSSGGKTANPSTPFEAANCEGLGFSPKLALSLKGATTRAKDPALKAVLTAPAGQANIGKVQVVLPPSVFIDNRHISNPCTRVQFEAGAGNGTQCPARSILGKATAYSPLLDQPLTGNVYFRSNGGERKLPDLVASLDGQIHVNLVGFIDSVHKKGTETSRTRNTFAAVPDAPVSKFVLELDGGKKGLLQNSTNLCKSTNKATVKMDGQNGKVNDFETVVKPSCGNGKSPRTSKQKGK